MRNVYERQPDGRSWSLIASFELLESGAVKAAYHEPSAQRFLEGGVVTGSDGRRIVPADGPVFYERLALSFSRSTMYDVRDE